MELSNSTVKQENGIHGNEQRKSSGVPTLVITVKNEMAQPIDEQTIPTAGKINYSFFFKMMMRRD
jgi:hypothetical protein